MGCDIHCYLEYRTRQEERWESFGVRINPGRNYTMFGYLAGVRCDGPPVVPVRGLPINAGYSAKDDAALWISETDADGYVTAAQAARYVEACGSQYIDDKRRVTHPDWHSHSWMTPQEWDQAIALTQAENSRWGMPEYKAISAALHSLANEGEAR